ncbi:hypothetical protein WJ01_00240 [Burkholderia vietnamiensis]|nr:hypothetical protein WJ01_00240 [Burkholderia vietnamiensis]
MLVLIGISTARRAPDVNMTSAHVVSGVARPMSDGTQIPGGTTGRALGVPERAMAAALMTETIDAAQSALPPAPALRRRCRRD